MDAFDLDGSMISLNSLDLVLTGELWGVTESSLNTFSAPLKSSRNIYKISEEQTKSDTLLELK